MLGLAGLLVAVLAVAVVTAASGGGREPSAGDGRSEVVRTSSMQDEPAFQPCEAGPRGGGFRIRVVRISCAETRQMIPDMFDEKLTRLVDSRESEKVYANEAGWSCLVQALPGEATSQVLCVRGRQIILSGSPRQTIWRRSGRK